MRALALAVLVGCAHGAPITDAVEPAPVAGPSQAMPSLDQLMAWADEAETAAVMRHQLGDFREAIQFQRYVVTVRPTAEKFFVLAQYYRDAGELRHAAWVMQAFVHQAPTHPRRHEAERLIAEWSLLAPTCSAVADEPTEAPPAWTIVERRP